MEYKTLESNSLKSLGVDAPTFTGATPSFLATSTFVYTLFFTAIVAASFYRYVVAGALRMQASESGIRQSNEIIKKVTLGLLGVFSLFLILITVNKDLVSGNVGLSALGTTGGVGAVSVQGTRNTTVTQNQTTGVSSQSCESVDTAKARMTSPEGVCSNVRCTLLSGCNYQQFLPIIKEESAAIGIDYKITVVILCRESHGVINPPQRVGALANSDGSYDCGLMQINRKNKICEPAILDPRGNIHAGVQELKNKMNLQSQTAIVPGVPAMANTFADYNCCANGDRASSPSNDCTPANGFPANFPKWACPINPGIGPFAMCAVKNYACETSNCLNSVP
jgi:hypothetical protein